VVLLQLVVRRGAQAPEVGPLDAVAVRRSKQFEGAPGLPDVQVVLGQRHLIRVERHQVTADTIADWARIPTTTAARPGPSRDS
jgi:hypothetical protein